MRRGLELQSPEGAFRPYDPPSPPSDEEEEEEEEEEVELAEEEEAESSEGPLTEATAGPRGRAEGPAGSLVAEEAGEWEGVWEGDVSPDEGSRLILIQGWLRMSSSFGRSEGLSLKHSRISS